MEYEIYISGIGGQGVQLVAKTLVLAGLAEGRHVMLTGEYGSLMRGGSSLASVVIGSTPLRALPVIAHARAALVLHQLYWDAPCRRMRRGALVVVEDAIYAQLPQMPEQRVVRVPAMRVAVQIGNPMSAGLALLAAFAAATNIVETDNLIAAMKTIVPPYRRQHLETNEQALRLGAGLVTRGSWPIEFNSDSCVGSAA